MPVQELAFNIALSCVLATSQWDSLFSNAIVLGLSLCRAQPVTAQNREVDL